MNKSPSSDRLNWFLEARFGLSFHWGIASVPGRGDGWLRSAEQMSITEYQPYFEQFQPEPGCMKQWMQLAKKAGAEWVLLTTKHHDGFCLFDSALTEYKATNCPAQRDLVREFVDEARAVDLRVGFYYSMLDWHHEDYPAAGDRQHPLRHEAASVERDEKGDWSRYVKYAHGQVRELLSNYGKIDLLVFDFSYWQYMGERWGATELMKLVRELQPEIVLNDRLEPDAICRVPRPAWAGDFSTAEMNIPRGPTRTDAGERVPFDAWFPLGANWFYDDGDEPFKSAKTMIRALVNCVSKGGNLHLNLGPDAKGGIHPEQAAILCEVGDWLSVNGESIRGCDLAEFPKPEWGRFTQKGRTLYAHILEQGVGLISLPGLRGRVKDPRGLRADVTPRLCDYWNPGIQRFDEPEDIFLTFAENSAGTTVLPDECDTVVAFELTDEAEAAALCEQYVRDWAAALEQKPML